MDTPTDLLGSETTARAILELGHGFDHVIVDTPPVLAVADVLVLAPSLDATLMVVSLAEASTAQVAEAGTELALAGARVLGAALNNDADTGVRSASAYAYGIRCGPRSPGRPVEGARSPAPGVHWCWPALPATTLCGAIVLGAEDGRLP